MPLPYEIDHDFFLSDFVTQEIWVEVMGENPSYYPNVRPCPEEDLRVILKLRSGKDGKEEIKEIQYCEGWAVTNISLFDARKFVHIMNMGSPFHVKYDIPTEWQFDLAARGGLVSETKDGIINTGRFGSLEVRDLETFKTKIPWNGDSEKGPGRTKQRPPFPRPIGPHDLIGHLESWTKSRYLSSRLGGRFLPCLTNTDKKMGTDISLGETYFTRGHRWSVQSASLDVGSYYCSPPDATEIWLGLRLLRTNHRPL